MKNLDTVLGSIEIRSMALGYRVLDSILRLTEARVLELAPAGERLLIFLTGRKNELDEAIKSVRKQLSPADSSLWVDSETIETESPLIQEALFSLSQVSLGESLVIVEGSTVSRVLATAHALVDEGSLKPIEIRVQRSSTGGAYGFFTGSAKDCRDAVSSLGQTLKNGVRIELIDHPSKGLREYFSLEASPTYSD